jgi:rhamnogalacturonan endolyase
MKPKEFPAVVNYVVGKSDPRKDWNFAQYPGSVWTVHFSLGFVPRYGKGFLYVTLAGGSGAAHLSVMLNGKDISGPVMLPNPLASRAAGAVVVDDIGHDQVRGFYRESVYSFGPSVVLQGDNALVLRVDGSKPTDGLMYDCLRMEMRADSTDPYGLDPENGNLPVYLPKNGMIDGMKIKQTYQGDPSGKYGLNPSN